MLIQGMWFALAGFVPFLILKQVQVLHAMQKPGLSHFEISQSEILNLRSSRSEKTEVFYDNY
jgi:hypothetical protein